MAHFAYKARDATGALIEGFVESADSGAAAAQLFRRGVVPIDITPAAGPAAAIKLEMPMLRRGVPELEVMLFSRQLHTLLKAGVPIMRGLTGLHASTAHKGFAAVIQDLLQGLDTGRELSASLARHPAVFSAFYVHMVKIGEMTGRLDEIFLRLYHHLEFEKFMREQVRAALRYPSFVLISMAAAIVVINLFVIPAFAKVYKTFNAKLPLMTQILVDFSAFMQTSWPLLLVGGVGAYFGFRTWTRQPRGRLQWDRLKLRIPVAGKIVLKATLARFARSFALATRSGVPVIDALTTVARTVDNAHIGSKVEAMRHGVERGESLLRTATAAGVFTPVVLQMVAVGEETGAMDELMQEIGDLYQREVEYELKTLSAQIEPFLIVCLGALVLVLALGVFLPIWDLGRTMIK
ncbi:MAG TPA: type II secretion system F family protein [Burkholderiales bacterium]|nr:type II secretion system F family protein [Burkholderiales bacterium]